MTTKHLIRWSQNKTIEYKDCFFFFKKLLFFHCLSTKKRLRNMLVPAVLAIHDIIKEESEEGTAGGSQENA